MHFANLLLSICLFTFGSAAFGISPDYPSHLSQVLKPFTQSKGVHAEIERTVVSPVLESQTTEKGRLWVAGDSLRLEVKEPQESLMLLTKNRIWVETRPDGAKGPVHVTRGRMANQSHSRVIFGILGGQKWDHHWELVTGKGGFGDNQKIVYELKLKKSHPDVKWVKLTAFPLQDGTVEQIEWADELENRTILKLKNLQFLKVVPKKQFQYSPPKGASITEVH